MNLESLNLLVPDKADVERQDICDAWQACNGKVVRLARFWEPPTDLPPRSVRLYGNDTFCLVVAQKLGLALISPSDNFPCRVRDRWWGREVDVITLSAAVSGAFPRFVKPLVPKQFAARVYGTAEELAKEAYGLPLTTYVLSSSVVEFQAEARCFVLNGTVLDCAVYEGQGEVSQASQFARAFTNDTAVPPACVIDVGLLGSGDWVFIEANAAWGAGLNGCQACHVLPAIERATRAAQ